MYSCRSYRKTDGIVAKVERKVSDSRSGTENPGIAHYAYFTYTVDGKKYEGKVRIFFPFVYRAGKCIKVYYDPADPERIIDRFVLETSCFGLFFVLIFLTVVIAAIRQRNSIIMKT